MPNDHIGKGDEYVSVEASASADTPLTSPNTDEEIERAAGQFHQRRSCRVIVDSSSDFAPAVLKRLGLEYIPISYVTPEGERLDDLWESQTPHEFYEAIKSGKARPMVIVMPNAGGPKTAETWNGYFNMPGWPYHDFFFQELLPEVEKKYHCGGTKDMRAVMGLSMGGGGSTVYAQRHPEVYEWACHARYFVHGYFILDGFDALAAGGRIPPAAAQVGTKLDIKPELTYETNGSLSLCGLHRGRRKALRAILQSFRENYCNDTSLPLAIVSSDAEKDADWLEAQVRKEKGLAGVTIIRSSISPILGTHVGPGMVGFTFWGGDRREKMSLTDRIARKVRSIER